MKIVIFGLAITSSWGNGHATTYRSLCGALHKLGHDIVFFEHEVEWYVSNSDLPDPLFCRVVRYSDWSEVRGKVRTELAGSDVAIIGSYFHDSCAALAEMLYSTASIKAFYDIDTPVTIAGLRQSNQSHGLSAVDFSQFDVYFSFTGGPVLEELQRDFAVKLAVPLYCSVDPNHYFPLERHTDFACELSYMGTYAPDRQAKVTELLCAPALRFPEKGFIVAGPQYPNDIPWPGNVRRIAHLEPKYHPHLYSSSKIVLNLTRRDMVMAGYSPSVRLFEAAACGAAIVSDNWPGIEQFFSPGSEILLIAGTDDVCRVIDDIPEERLKVIGRKARQKVLDEHSSDRRARQFEDYIQLARSKSPKGARPE